MHQGYVKVKFHSMALTRPKNASKQRTPNLGPQLQLEQHTERVD